MGCDARGYTPLNQRAKMDQKKIEYAVTQVCDQGCTYVRLLIQKLETDVVIAETAALSQDERRAVLAELKSIMAIYGSRQ